MGNNLNEMGGMRYVSNKNQKDKIRKRYIKPNG